MKISPFLILFCSLVSTQIQAGSIRFSSGDQRVSVIELYTSEGCSSCPPADQWLSQFKQDDRLWKEIIPIAFHVDYWNYIGWPDRFANSQFSARQQHYAQTKNISTVYTPAVMLNGREWRKWRYFPGTSRQSIPLDQSSAGILQVDLMDKNFTAHYSTAEQDKNFSLNIALLGFDLQTEVRAGENRGRNLRHDFVVLGYDQFPMTKSGDQFFIDAKLPVMVETAASTGLVVWVEAADGQTPLQATGGWLIKSEDR